MVLLPGPCCRAQQVILCTSATSPAFSASSYLLHKRISSVHTLHFSQIQGSPHVGHAECMNRHPINSWFIFGRNKIWSKLSEVKQSAEPGSAGCPFPITQGVQSQMWKMLAQEVQWWGRTPDTFQTIPPSNFLSNHKLSSGCHYSEEA